MVKTDKKYQFKLVEACNMCQQKITEKDIIGRRLDGSQGRKPNSHFGITVTIVRCSNCGLHFPNPLPIPIDIQDHYGVLPEDYWTENYFKLEDNSIDAIISKLKKFIDFEQPKRALDIGAGLGKTMKALEKHNFDTYGIEASIQFHERAILKMGISPEKIQCEMIENAEFPENHFDFITFGAVLEHLYDPAGSIEKAMKWLKPGGIIQIQVPSSNWLVGKILNTIYRLMGTRFVSNLSPFHTPFHLYEFDEQSFQKHAKINNYKVVDVQYEVCQTMVSSKFDFILKPIMKSRNSGMEIYVLLQK